MLQNIRELTQGWIAGVIISIIILTFALWGIHSYFEGSGSNNIVAEVNGVEISKEQFAIAYDRLRRQTQGQFNNLAKDELTLKQQALDLLIEREVLKQASLAEGFKISSGQIDGYLQSMPEFQVDGQFSMERFQEVLSSTLLSTGDFLDLINISLLIDQPKLGIVFTSFAMPDETNATIALVNQERDIDFLNIPLQGFLSQVTSIAPEKVTAYYEQHKNDFMTPEQVSVEYIEMSLSGLASEVHPTEEALKSFYNENINAYSQPMEWKLATIVVPVKSNTAEETNVARAKADEIARSLKEGADINTVIHQNPGSEMGKEWLTLGRVSPELQKTVAGLGRDQISEPTKAGAGFIIVKAVDVKEPRMQPFEAVKGKVTDTYVRQQAEEKFAQVREQLADMTYEHPDSLQYAAKSLHLPVQTTELFSIDKGGKDITQYKKVRTTAFSNDVLKLQNNSEVIQANPETLVVLRVKSHVASTLLPLKNIAKQIEDKLKAKYAEEQAGKAAADLAKQLQSGGDASQIAALHHYQWNKLGHIGRYAHNVDSAILDLAFRLPNPSHFANKPTFGVTRMPNGYAIVALKSVKEGTIADSKQYAVFAEQVQNSDGFLEYELYKQSQIAEAKIKKYAH